MIRHVISFRLICLWLAWPCACAAGDEVRRFVNLDQTVIGRPVHWDDSEQRLTVLGNDGALWSFDAQTAQTSQKLTIPFRSLTQAEMRSSLIAEFGDRFEVTATGSYLVVHPRGEQAAWAQRFDTLYRQMQRYFSVRGITVHPPLFPLVAVVFPTQQEFMQYAQESGIPVSSAVLGFYSLETNRIILFDVTAGGRVQQDWRVNAETIVHEAAHQTAFNVGIHNRFTPPPRWICEGLGTLFEAPGVYDSLSHPNLRDRINTQQLEIYRKRVSQGLPPGVLKALVASDKPYRYAPDTAYAISWAATFMFAETQPQDLARYLQGTAARPPFSTPTPVERLQDFERAFGNDYQMLEARIQRFMNEI
jgi:hypothetical protein